MKRLSKEINKLLNTGFFHVFGGSVLCKMVGFLSTTVLVHLLSKQEYGTFTYSWNIYNMICLVSGIGLVSALLQLCSERNGEPEYINAAFSYGAKYATFADCIFGLVLLGVGFFVPLVFLQANVLICLMCLLPAIHLQTDLILVYFRARKDNRKYAFVSLFSSISVFFCVNAGAAFFRVTGVIFGYYVAYTATAFFGIYTLNGRVYGKSTYFLNKIEKRELWTIALTSMCIETLSQLMYFLDIFVLGIIAAEETVLASYRVATVIPTALTFIPSAIVTYIYPYFAEHRKDKNWCLNSYKKIVVWIGILNVSIAIFLIIFAPLIIRIFFGDQYLDATLIFRILAINYIFSGTFRIVSGNLLVTQRKLKFNFFVVVVSSISNILGDYFFIQWWGAIGAAMSTMMVVLIASVISTSYLIYILKTNRTT